MTNAQKKNNLTIDVSIKDADVFKVVLKFVREIIDKDEAANARFDEIMSEYGYETPCESCDPINSPICTKECQIACPECDVAT